MGEGGGLEGASASAGGGFPLTFDGRVVAPRARATADLAEPAECVGAAPEADPTPLGAAPTDGVFECVRPLIAPSG